MSNFVDENIQENGKNKIQGRYEVGDLSQTIPVVKRMNIDIAGNIYIQTLCICSQYAFIVTTSFNSPNEYSNKLKQNLIYCTKRRKA